MNIVQLPKGMSHEMKDTLQKFTFSQGLNIWLGGKAHDLNEWKFINGVPLEKTPFATQIDKGELHFLILTIPFHLQKLHNNCMHNYIDFVQLMNEVFLRTLVIINFVIKNQSWMLWKID